MGLTAVTIVLAVIAVLIVIALRQNEKFKTAQQPLAPETRVMTEVVTDERSFDDISTAVLYALPRFKCIGKFDVVTGGGWLEIESDRAMISKYREWLKTQPDPMVVRAYNKWLDFYERRTKEVEQALQSGYKEQWQAERKAEREEHAAKLRRAGDVPKP